MITLINGNPQNLAGLIVPNGSISLQLNVDATVIAAPYGFVGAEQVVSFQFNSVGAIQPNSPAAAAKIYSNLELNPQNTLGLGTYYLVTFYDANGARINNTPMWWQFPQAANSTVDIGQMTAFSTVGGNVIYYPTIFPVPTPGISSLGGVFANAGATSKWITAINTDGTVTLTQPAFSDISGTIASGQLPSPLVTSGVLTAAIFNATTGFTINSLASASGHVLRGNGTNYVDATLAAADLSNGVTGTGTVVLSASPTVTGTFAGAIITASTGYRNGTMTSGRVLRSDGTNFISAQLAAADLSNGVTGSGAVALAGSPTFTGTVAGPIFNATTGIQINGAATLANVLRGNGTNFISAALAAADLSNGVSGSGAVVLVTGATMVTPKADVLDLSGTAASTTAGHLNIGSTVATPSGAGSTPVLTNAAGGGLGPTDPLNVVGYVQMYLGTQKIWVPYFI